MKTSKGKNLYEFWDKRVQENVLDDLASQKSDLLINLASKEYFSVLGKMPDYINVISPVFKDYKNGKHKIISFYAEVEEAVARAKLVQMLKATLNKLLVQLQRFTSFA